MNATAPAPKSFVGNAIVFLLGFFVFANTLSNQYALDDKLVILNNQITQKGWAGVTEHFKYDAMDGFWADQYGRPVEEISGKSMVSGGRYRPLTLATHAIEWGLFGRNPKVSHGINAFLYACLGLVLFLLVQRIWPTDRVWYKDPAFWLVALYLVHPLHSEVVANIKGRDELLSFLFAALAMWVALIGYDRQKIGWIVGAGGLFFASLLCKETSIPFLVLIPLMFYFFREMKSNLLGASVVSLLAFTGIYLLIRFSVLGGASADPPSELMNNPFLLATGSQKWATVLLTFTAYLKLLIVPHPLTHDYYPFHLPFTEPLATYPEMSHPAVWLGVIFLLAMVALALYGLIKRAGWSFGILFFLGTWVLVSNALFPVGVFMNDRFMFMPSFGFFFALFAWKRTFLSEARMQWIPYVMIPFCLVYGYLTWERNQDWENDETLALADVQVSQGSAKAHMAAGDALLKQIRNLPEGPTRQELVNQAFDHLKTSLEIYPQYFPPRDLLAVLYFEVGNYSESIRFYEYCLQSKPDQLKFVDNIVFIGDRLVQEKRFQEALAAYQKAVSLRPSYSLPLLRLGEVYGRDLQDPGNAIRYLEQAQALDPGNPDIMQKLGIGYAMAQQTEKAIQWMEKSLESDPNNINTLNNLGVVYMNSGNAERAQFYLNRARALGAKNGAATSP